MSDESSRQQHPEADLLAGFAENSLTQHERESVLSHLAMCARCRQVVFLAHRVDPTGRYSDCESEGRPFWRRNWFPVMASASAVVALAAITFCWYGQSHRATDRLRRLRSNGLPTLPVTGLRPRAWTPRRRPLLRLYRVVVQQPGASLRIKKLRKDVSTHTVAGIASGRNLDREQPSAGSRHGSGESYGGPTS